MGGGSSGRPQVLCPRRGTHISSSSSSQTISTHNYIACCPFLYVYIYNAYCPGPMKRPMIAPYAIAIETRERSIYCVIGDSFDGGGGEIDGSIDKVYI
jgi:hypothetical protein